MPADTSTLNTEATKAPKPVRRGRWTAQRMRERRKKYGASLPKVLPDFVLQREFADEFGVTEHTVMRWRKQGLPYIDMGGIHIGPLEEARAFVMARVQRRNPKRVK